MDQTRKPRQERSRQTRDALLDAAETLGSTKSFDQISVQEIATAAGFTIGAFYARFPSKGALVQSLMERYESMAIEARKTLSGLDAGDQPVLHLTNAFVNAYSANRGRLRLIESAMHTDDLLATKVVSMRKTIIDFATDSLSRAYALPRHELETAVLLLTVSLRELHFRREFWPATEDALENLTSRIADAVVAFLNNKLAASAKSPGKRRKP